MSEKVERQLRDQLQREVHATCEEAVRPGGRISAEQMETLARLARLVELREAVEAQYPRRRWPAAVALAVTLLIGSGLFFARIRETEVTLNVAVSELSFELPSPQVLSERMALASLGVSGLSEIQLPDTLNREDRVLLDPDGVELAIRMASGSKGTHRGTIDLEPIVSVGVTRVWVRLAEASGLYRLALKSPDLSLHVDLHGPVLLELPGAAARPFDVVSPRAVFLQSGPGVIDMDLVFRDPSKTSLSPRILVSSLDFFQVEQFGDADRSVVRRLSTVLSGTLYFESLDGLARPLRPGEQIRLGHARGELRAVRLHDDHISLTFHGRVRGLNTGPDDSPSSLMPTWFEWLKARHGLSLLWGTVIYFFGVIVGIMRWLRVQT